jgi:hypothetical protein
VLLPLIRGTSSIARPIRQRAPLPFYAVNV